MSLASVLEDEIHDRLSIVKAAGAVIDAPFANHHDLATELLVALLDDGTNFKSSSGFRLADVEVQTSFSEMAADCLRLFRYWYPAVVGW